MPTAAQRHDDGMSLGEVARLIEALRKENGDRFDKIDDRFDRLDSTFLRKGEYEADNRARNEYIAGLERRTGGIESNLQWIVRIVVSAVVVALISGLFAVSKIYGG